MAKYQPNTFLADGPDACQGEALAFAASAAATQHMRLQDSTQNLPDVGQPLRPSTQNTTGRHCDAMVAGTDADRCV